MANITPPYADIGAAKFEVLDTYLMSHLLAGMDPPLQQPYSYLLPANVTLVQFSVVGLKANGKLALAKIGQDPVAATGTLTFSGVGTASDTITIGSRTYTLVSALTAADQVLIGGSVTASAANLVAAINGAAGAGTTYGTGTTPHSSVSASSAVGVVTITAEYAGSRGNQIVTTEAGSGTAFGAATLTGGRDRGGIAPIGVLAHAVSSGASTTTYGQVFYSGHFNMSTLVWDASFTTDALKLGAFAGAPAPTTILVSQR